MTETKTDSFSKEEKKKFEKTVMPMWLGITSKLSAGSIAGYMAGNFIKQITD